MEKTNQLFEKIKEIKNLKKKIKEKFLSRDYDPYLHGMVNGLIFAISILEEKNPNFLKRFIP